MRCCRIRGNEVGPDQRMNMISVATLLQVRSCWLVQCRGWMRQGLPEAECVSISFLIGSIVPVQYLATRIPSLRPEELMSAARSLPCCRKRPATMRLRCGGAAPRALPATRL